MARGFRGKHSRLKYFNRDAPYVLHMGGLSSEAADAEIEFLKTCHFFCQKFPSENRNSPSLPTKYDIWKCRKEELHHITRFDYGNTHGWFARIYHNKEVSQRLFSDGVYGGIEVSLQEAQKWRDNTLSNKVNSRINPVTGKPLHFRRILQKNNKSGVVGVYFSCGVGRGGSVCPYVAATWYDGEKGHSKKFYYSGGSIGRDAAFWMAKECRKSKEVEFEKGVCS